MIEKWNSDCFCVSLNSAALRAALNARMMTSSPASELLRHGGITSRLK
jgi:hypothetical protein